MIGARAALDCHQTSASFTWRRCWPPQVLHIDRNNYYGGQSASLNLNQVSARRQESAGRGAGGQLPGGAAVVQLPRAESRGLVSTSSPCCPERLLLLLLLPAPPACLLLRAPPPTPAALRAVPPRPEAARGAGPLARLQRRPRTQVHHGERDRVRGRVRAVGARARGGAGG